MSNIFISLDIKKDLAEKIIDKSNIIYEIQNHVLDLTSKNIEKSLISKVQSKLEDKNNIEEYILNLVGKDIKEELIKKVNTKLNNRNDVKEYILNLVGKDIKEELIKKINTKLGSVNPVEDYVLDLISKDINSKIYFKNEIYFDYEKQKLFNKDEEIIFTRLEYKLFRFLLNNLNTLVTFEQIKSFVWKNENVTRFTIRNFIKKIRDKTYRDLVFCKSNCGYILLTDD